MQRFAVALLAAALSTAAAAADTRAIALVVTDAQGAFVPDVRADEVRVLENGEVRELVSFERDERRLAVVLVLDTLVEAAESLGRESGRRRALVAVSGAGAGHTSFSPGDVSAQVRKGGARVLGVMYREGESGGAGSLMGLDVPRDAANLTIVGAGDHERVLSGLARATGGRLESVPTVLGVSRLLESLGAELGGQYRLRYAGSDAKGPRQVDVRLARTGVRWRVAIDSP
jgi:hypothetical protein